MLCPARYAWISAFEVVPSFPEAGAGAEAGEGEGDGARVLWGAEVLGAGGGVFWAVFEVATGLCAGLFTELVCT